MKDLDNQLDDLIRYKPNEVDTKRNSRFSVLNDFYNNKTILPNNKFIVEIFDDETNGKKKLYDNIGLGRPLTNIRPHHILEVTYPIGYNFEPLFTSRGLNSNVNIDSFEQDVITISFEEDAVGTVQRLYNWLIGKIIRPDGVFRPKSLQMIDEIKITKLNSNDQIVSKHIYTECVLVGGPTAFSNSYTDDSPANYELTFIYDDSKKKFIDDWKNWNDFSDWKMG